MSYHFSTHLHGRSFEQAVEEVVGALQEEGFGVLTDINVAATLKKKIGEDIRPYRILGACNPRFAHKAIQVEGHIGVFLPCNVLLQQHSEDDIEVSAVDPIASMSSVENESLGAVASEVQEMMKRVIAKLS
jgi:uncharacterized protein (DUF302 family)